MQFNTYNLEYKEDISRFEEILRRSRNAVAVSHFKPDGDAVGSLMACCHYLRSRGISVTPVLPSPLADYLSFVAPEGCGLLVYQGNETAVDAAVAAADTIICLDFNKLSRTEFLERQISESRAVKVLIDHHASQDGDGFDLVYATTEVSSTCELLFHILMQMPDVAGDVMNLSMDVANSLYVGMMTDTNNFANSVSPSTFGMGAALLSRGVDKNSLQFAVLNNHSEQRMRLMGHLLKDKMVVVPEYGAAYMILTDAEKKEYSFRSGDSEGLVNLPLSIAGVRLSAFFTECADDGYVRVSLRSRPGTDVNALSMASFNGGGHVNAAGGRLYMAPEDIPAYFLDSLRRYFDR